ncbi:MAG TPA: S41 family peptidase [Gemmatimonadaceae bacterium]|jgi:carboxyl-terminal processing protease
MPRFRTAAVATLLLVPIVAGGFLLQEPPVRASAVLFEQVLSLVKNAYVDSLSSDAMFDKAATGLVRELNDPYSELFAPKESEDFNRTVGGRYGGTGMLLGNPSKGVVTVDRVFPNTPAEEGGVREGDRLITIDSTPVSELAFDAVSIRLRGEIGTKVSVTYARPGVTEPIKLKFTRREVHIPAVTYSTLVGDHIGYVPLQTFNENAAVETQTAIESLIKQGAKGIVLDMRDNGGGIVEQALETASLFLQSGQDIVSVRSRNAAPETSRAEGKRLDKQVPLIVIVDGGSASATEIVAGALQDHDRALILGSQSFGKGLVQSVYRLDGGYNLKLTTGKWYTPSGRSIHRERKLMPNGEFVEVHPDSLAALKMTRPTFKSDAGRIVYGGGGVRPDVLVAEDTISTAERNFFRTAAPQIPKINSILQDYALQLKGSVSPGFTPPPAWTTEVFRRMTADSVVIDPKIDAGAKTAIERDLANRVARLSFGDAAAKVRLVKEDKPLSKAIELLEKNATQAQLLAAAPPQKEPARK